MRSFSAALFVLAAAASQVAATIYVTAPVASTTCVAGQTCPVNWNDDGNTPALGTIGVCDIYLATGGSQQQTTLQNIGTDDVSLTAGITFVPDASVGPNGDYYFIKFISRNYKDAATPTVPFVAFSAKFTLSGMSGTFNQTVLDQIASGTGGSTSAAAASTTAAVSSSAAGSTTAAASKTTTSSAHATTTTAKTTSGAVTMSVPGVVSSITGLAVFTSFMSLFLGALAFGF